MKQPIEPNMPSNPTTPEREEQFLNFLQPQDTLPDDLPQPAPSWQADDPNQLAQHVGKVLDHMLVSDLIFIPENEVSYASCILLGTARSLPHLRSSLNRLRRHCSKFGFGGSLEGYPSSQWQLLDLGGVIIHLQTKEARQYYDLDGLWIGRGELDCLARSS